MGLKSEPVKHAYESRQSSRPLAFRRDRLIDEHCFASDVAGLSPTLAAGGQSINLCDDRYRFLVAFFATVSRGGSNIMPPTQSEEVVAEMMQRYPSAALFADDGRSFGAQVGRDPLSLALGGSGRGVAMLSVTRDAQSPAVVSFTSGSTGEPVAHAHGWGVLRTAAQLALESLDLLRQKWLVVATVPPQHMYGLETSILWPLCSRLIMDVGRPFYPEEIRRRIESAPFPCLLVSTPHHLAACIESDRRWNNVAMILSSTAPMAGDLATRVEALMQAPLHELFGSTETLSFAWRRPAEQVHWRLYSGMRVFERDGRAVLHGGHLPQPVPLADRFRIHSERAFSLIGRRTDIIKIAGKRSSLAELDRRLTAIDGVHDGLFFMPGTAAEQRARRPAAMVVSALPKQAILEALKRSLDPVFLPRPLLIVDRIPRNAVGKVVRSQLQQMLVAAGLDLSGRDPVAR